MAIPASLRQELADIPVLEDPGSVRMRSRDFFWFSPILKETLEDKRAELVVVPRDKADVMRTAAATLSGVNPTPHRPHSSNVVSHHAQPFSSFHVT